jgi:hypothetical protein
LIDPWLDESEQVDYHASFSQQKRTTPALANSIDDLEALLKAEDAEAESNSSTSKPRPKSHRIDAILLSHPFTDHMHPPTIQKGMSEKTLFLVTWDSKAALMSLLGGKRKVEERGINVLELVKADFTQKPAFLNNNERNQTAKRALPYNLEIMQLQPRERFSLLAGPAGIAWSKLHGAILIMWSNPDHKDSSASVEHHSMLYTPHGISPTSIPTWLHKSATIESEAILTSLDKIVLPNWLSGVVNLGLPAAIDLIKQEVYTSKRILATHDERKEAKGLVATLIKRYWLGQSTPEAENQGLTHLKQQDEKRQQEGQNLVDSQLDPFGKKAKVLVLEVGEIISLED